jgi:hypothetical protein
VRLQPHLSDTVQQRVRGHRVNVDGWWQEGVGAGTSVVGAVGAHFLTDTEACTARFPTAVLCRVLVFAPGLLGPMPSSTSSSVASVQGTRMSGEVFWVLVHALGVGGARQAVLALVSRHQPLRACA